MHSAISPRIRPTTRRTHSLLLVSSPRLLRFPVRCLLTADEEITSATKPCQGFSRNHRETSDLLDERYLCR